MKSGFMLDIKANFTSKKSLQIIHITNQHSFNQTRSLINVGKNSEIELIVSYIGINDSKFLSNACIEINQEANSKLKLTKIQNNTQSGNLLYNLKSDLAKDASFYYNSFNLKAKSSREAIAVNLNESNAECTINGIYLLDDKNKSHHLIKVNHLAPFTYSKQLFKGLLYSEAKAEFNGGVFVAPGADGTNAEQLNQNLLLSERAHVDTRPTLDIYADDVKCNHGATIGELDASEIFYLMSRGISKDKALALLTLSFCEEVFENINLDSVKTFIRKEALAKVDESFKSHLQQKGSPFKA
jgi:Fe-S cluster assembly protein SufD